MSWARSNSASHSAVMTSMASPTGGTMPNMVAMILVLNFDAIGKDQAGWNWSDVWESLRATIVDQLGVSPDEVRDSATFVDDLGMD
jgi:hypothetical protein